MTAREHVEFCGLANGGIICRPDCRCTCHDPVDMPRARKRRPFTVWEGERGGSARGMSYRTRLRAIIAAWWASLYSGHDVWIERDMPRAEFVPQTGPHGPAGDSGAASEGPPPPPAPPRRWARGSGL